MFLLEKTPAAKLQRTNVLRLLRSENDTNIKLALATMQEGGLPLLLLIDVYRLIFKPWQLSDAAAAERTATAGDLIARHFPKPIVDYMNHCLAEIDLRYGPSFGMFRGSKLWEMLLQEGVASMADLVEIWQENLSYLRDSDLTLFLLQNCRVLDPNIFIDPRLNSVQLNRKEMKPLLASHDGRLDRTAFLRQYVQGPILNLSNTGITEIPAECEAFEGITELDIRGTALTEIPVALLRRLRRIHANKRMHKMLRRQVLALPEQDFYYAAQMRWQLAMLSRASKNIAVAMTRLDQVSIEVVQDAFDAAQQAEFWEVYFDTAFQHGDAEKQASILEAALSQPAIRNKFWGWKNRFRYMTHWVQTGTIAQWQALTARHFPPEHKPLTLLNHEFWIAACHRAVSCHQQSEAKQLLEMALPYVREKILWYFPWYQLLKNLRGEANSAELVGWMDEYGEAILAKYKHWPADIGWSGDAAAILIEAYMAQGRPALAELWCSHLIGQSRTQIGMRYGYPRSDVHYANRDAAMAYRYLARIHATAHPACAATFEVLATRISAMSPLELEDW